MGVLLALASALGYGLSDFLGGVLSRRASFVRVALLGQLGGLVVMALAAPLTASTPPRLPDVVWGALSGLGTGIDHIHTRELLLEHSKDLFDKVRARKLQIDISRRYPLGEAKQAHIDIESRGTTGKLLLDTRL